jgi:HK97 family phage major capsid protein
LQYLFHKEIIMSEEIKAIQAGLDNIKSQLDAKLADHTNQIERFGKASTETTGQVDKLAQRFVEAEAKLQDLAQKSAAGWQQPRHSVDTLGSLVLKSEQVKNFMQMRSGSVQIEVKNTIIGEGGSPQNPVDTIVAPDRRDGIVPGAFRALSVLDVVPMGSTSSNQVHYTQELAFTNNAAERAEGVAKPESSLTFQLIEEPVRTIAHFIKMSKQVLDDAPALEGYVNRRLSHGVRNRLEFQILRGNGTSPNLAGLSASGNHTEFTPATGDTALDSLNKAKYAAIGADFMADTIFMNPASWGAIERAKVTGGAYVLGDGAAITYVASGMIPRVWGMNVVLSNNVESGKFYVLDVNAIEMMLRQAVTVEMGFVNDDFTKNLFTLRAEMRGALAVYQPTAVRYGSLTL